MHAHVMHKNTTKDMVNTKRSNPSQLKALSNIASKKIKLSKNILFLQQ